MSYQPIVPTSPRSPAARSRARGPNGARRRAVGLGELGASAQVATIQAAVSAVPVVGSILGPLVGPLSSLFDPGARRDAGRKQRAEGISKLANEGSLLAARQLYGAAEKGAVGAKAEIAEYQPLWAAFKAAHPDIAAAAIAAGPSSVGPDPANGWTPPASDVAQYAKEIQQYQQYGTAASAAQAATARTAGFPGGALGVGLGLAFLAKVLGSKR